jgi:hypothetical protein
MAKYMLITVCEREIYTSKFDNYEDARNAMLNRLFDEYWLHGDYADAEEAEEDWRKIISNNCYNEPDNKFAFGPTCAWSNIDPDYNLDWEIVEI